MFFQLLYIHLFRPFLKYTATTSPLPAQVSPRKLCTQAATMISKLLRLYRRSHGLRQICNIAVYIAHSACTIHLLNLPDKGARRDITHGVKHLEEIAECWLCARRTLGILHVLAGKWKVELPEEAALVLERCEAKFGPYHDVPTPKTPSMQQVPEEEMQSTSPANAEGASPTQPYDHHHALQHDTTTTSTTISPTYQAYTNAIANSHNNNNNTNGGSSNTTFPPPLRKPSDTNPPPPSSAAEFTTSWRRRIPSAATSPGQQTVRAGSSNSTTTTTTGASPSDLFGGVDALIRDSHDWWLRDQNSLALGFGNWGLPQPQPQPHTGSANGTAVAQDDAVWLNGGGGAVQAQGGLGYGAVVGVNGMHGPVNANVNGLNGINGLNGGGGVVGLGGLLAAGGGGGGQQQHGFGFGGGVSGYNEDEWYQ